MHYESAVTRIEIGPEKEFHDEDEFVFTDKGPFPLRFAVPDEHPDVYRLASINDDVLLQPHITHNYDDTYGFSRAVSRALRWEEFEKVLLDHGVVFQRDYGMEGRVCMAATEYEKFVTRAVAPTESRPAAKKDLKLIFDVRHSPYRPSRIRYQHRYLASEKSFEELEIDYFPWGDEFFDPNAAASFLNSQTYRLGCFLRPGSADDFDRRMPERNVIVGDRSFSVMPFAEAPLHEVNLMFLLNGFVREARHASLEWKPPAQFLVLKATDFGTTKLIVLLSVKMQYVDFFRSMWSPVLDQIAAAAELCFLKKLDSQRIEPSPLVTPIHGDEPKYNLMPLENGPPPSRMDA